MPFTDRSDIYAAVHEKGINTVVRHVMRQRPSLFNYATPFFHANPDLLCNRIEAAPTVVKLGNPLFTEVPPLPVFGSPVELGVNFCLQLTDAQIDFHPGNVFDLPGELGELPPQRFALRIKACAGVDCPPRDLIEQLVPFLEALQAQQQQPEGKERDRLAAAHEQPAGVTAERIPDSGRVAVDPRGPFFPIRLPERGVVVLPTRELICVCVELFAVGHFEWGSVIGSQQPWLKPRLDGLEIVDLGPEPLESALECYLTTVLRLGILPQLIVPMEKMILDVTGVLQDQGLEVGEQINLQASEVPADVPNNPAVEEDQLKVFVKLDVQGGS